MESSFVRQPLASSPPELERRVSSLMADDGEEPSAATLQHLHEYVEGELAWPSLEMLLRVLEFACARGLEPLCSETVAALLPLLDASNCVRMLRAADACAVSELRGAAINHIMSNFEEVRATADFAQLSAQLMLDVMRSVAPSDEQFATASAHYWAGRGAGGMTACDQKALAHTGRALEQYLLLLHLLGACSPPGEARGHGHVLDPLDDLEHLVLQVDDLFVEVDPALPAGRERPVLQLERAARE